MMKIRQSWDFFFKMGIHILVKRYIYIEKVHGLVKDMVKQQQKSTKHLASAVQPNTPEKSSTVLSS